MSIDWSKPLRVAGTDRPATVVSRDINTAVRRVFADWRGDGCGPWPVCFSDFGLSHCGEFAVENVPTPARDPETALRVAREAAARALEDDGDEDQASETREGQWDDMLFVQAALLAFTHGTDLLKPAEPVEPPEVTAARKVLEDWQRMQEGK